MKRYVARRLLMMPAFMVLISIVSFAVIQAQPGDFGAQYFANPRVSYETALQMRAQLGLDQPPGSSTWSGPAASSPGGTSAGTSDPPQARVSPVIRGRKGVKAVAVGEVPSEPTGSGEICGGVSSSGGRSHSRWVSWASCSARSSAW